MCCERSKALKSKQNDEMPMPWITSKKEESMIRMFLARSRGSLLHVRHLRLKLDVGEGDRPSHSPQGKGTGTRPQYGRWGHGRTKG